MTLERETTTPRPLVSVVIPAYNNEATLAATLDAVLRQTWQPLELVVVDDGSRDGTRAILQAYEGRVRAILQENRGIATARNVGVAAAKGEFIALLDGDDLCEPERVAVQVAALQRFPAAAACSSEFSAFTNEGVVSESFGRTYYSAIDNTPGGLEALYPDAAVIDAEGASGVRVACGPVYPALAFGNFVHPPTFMFRRAVLGEAGACDPAFRYTSDWEWFVRMARIGPFVHVFRPLLRYRLSPTQISRRASGAGMCADVIGAFEKMLAADPGIRAANPRRVRQTLADFYLDAAYANSVSNKRASLRQLAVAVGHGAWSAQAFRIAARIVLPPAAIEAIAARKVPAPDAHRGEVAGR